MAPRPRPERVARSIRLPAEMDEELVVAAKQLGLSINRAIEHAVHLWLNEN